MVTIENLPVETQVGNYFVSNYPPYSCWKPEYIPELEKALDSPPRGKDVSPVKEGQDAPATAQKPGPLGLYVHIPFCSRRCAYCYFRVYPNRKQEDVDLYVDTVLKEVALYKNRPAVSCRPLSSAYFGGGSPSYLSVEQIRRLLEGLQDALNWNEVEEFTYECDPCSLTPEKLKTLKELSVTRITLGFQTLNEKVLKRVGRNVPPDECLRAFRQTREAGFDEINIDLLAGLPGETTDSWRQTIDKVIELEPDCVTIYQMELTYNSRLYASIKAGRSIRIPSWVAKRSMVDEGFKALEGAGYVIGSGYMAIRHPDRWRFVYTVENYWHGADLLALGETAFGHFQGVHYQNADTFEQYVSRVSEGRLPVRRALRLTDEEKLRREVILLLKTGTLDAAYYRKKFGVELKEHFAEQIAHLEENGFLESDGDCIRLTREGLLHVDWLLHDFYLPEHRNVRYT